ncbi:unnamed protein product [Leptidea sinapis]|uniref:Elongator complex protein 1 n=1 Tax=Leptidea sinapis TaxID=189913 RepID=A0A5E4QWL3_9NEOP|nr:unnamed protein product [Leptidea sinapis]
MRNLQVLQITSRKLLAEDISCACYGLQGICTPGHLFLCTDRLLVRCFDHDGAVKWSKNLFEVTSLQNKPIHIQYLSLVDTLIVALTNGDIYGITGNGADFDLLSQEFGANEFITVGWGKKETQFHGSEGKQAAQVKSEFIFDKHAIVKDKVLISWKYHGNMFAVGFTMDGVRRFKVFDKSGRLQYTSEKVPGLESTLAWKPNGNFIATTQRFSNKYVVAFFEKNGLRHREFELPNDENIEVENILWSQDSDILTLVCNDLKDKSTKVFLYTTCNYHWYLKQVLTFSWPSKICKIMWDNDFDKLYSKKLHILFKNGKYYEYFWIWDVNHSAGKCKSDDGVVAVIDGKKLLLSSFRHSTVPPPMANFEIEINEFINAVYFLNEPKFGKDFNSFFICAANKLIFYEQIKKKPLKYILVKVCELQRFEFPLQSYNWYWWKKDTLICVELDKNNTYNLIEYFLYDNHIVLCDNGIEKVNNICMPNAALRLHSHPTIPKVYIHLITGNIMEYSCKQLNMAKDSFPTACSKFYVLMIGELVYFIGLTHKGVLYLQDKAIMNSVSSIFIHTDYFLITSFNSFLLCTKLTNEGIDTLIEYDKKESPDVYKRKIERGAKIVVVVPNSTKTVFQLPRGNLEVIEPRPLSLKIVGENLDSQNYYEAFDLMRKQRINLNLIYDHNPELFIQNIDLFLQSIQNNSWLSLFLTELENKDVTKTMYASNYADNNVNKQSENKINYICDIIRDKLNQSTEKNSKILPILTTYVKKNTINDLENALLVIKDLKAQELDGLKLPVSSDEALKYLLYIVDVNKLFDVALGMYDFDLVLLVANKSQKDPKEYIPMLNELNSMQENYRRYTINKNLKRYDKAVESLIQCGPNKHEELKTFVKYHSLYKDAIRLLPKDDKVYKEICDDFGAFLKLKKHYLEAGVMFERADNINKAVECYKEALEWEPAIKLAQYIPRDEFKVICWDFVHLLKEEKRHKEAIRILEVLNDDETQLINYAVENCEFKSAIRFCLAYDMQHYLESDVLPALLEEYSSVKEIIQTNAETFKRQKERLEVVRKNKLKGLTGRPKVTYHDRDDDLYSDFGSTIGSSTGSSRSHRSSKNRRKHERKVASLKEGSQYEDVALVIALHSLVTASFNLRSYVREINVALISMYKDEEARLLQFLLDSLLREMKEGFNQIWTHNFLIEATKAVVSAEENASDGGSVIRQGIATLAPHLRIAPVIEEIRWKLDID